VSGKNQLYSLAGQGKKYQSVTDYKTPWFKVPTNSTSYIRLFSKLPDSIGSNVNEYPFETHVSAPKVDIIGPDGSVSGHYAWWTADEGVKARLNLRDRYPDTRPDSARMIANLVAPPRGATELIPHWGSIPPDSKEPGYVLDVSGYANIEQLKGNLSQGGVISNISTTYAHAVTAYSQGLLTDVRDGGLKQDLSLVFEKNWAEFSKLPFGRDSYGNGSVTLNYPTPEAQGDGYGAPGKKWEWRESLAPMSAIANNHEIQTRPVFNIEFGGARNIRGPAWELLRDYYRLYQDKELGLVERPDFRNFADGVLRGRTFYPGIRAHKDTQNKEAISHIFNSQNAGSSDPFGGDTWQRGIVPRPIRISTAPYMSRYAFALGLQKSSDGNLRLNMFPFVAVRNPFNVPIRIDGQGGYNGYRVALRGKPREYSTPSLLINAGGKTYDMDLSELFGWNYAPYAGGYSIGLSVPSVTIPPGETWIFTPPDSEFHPIEKNIDAKQGFNLRGGWFMENFGPDDLKIKLGEGGEGGEGVSSISIQIGYNRYSSGGTSYNSGTFIREQIASWPGDVFPGGNTGVDDAVSEHSEPFMIIYTPRIHGGSFTKSISVEALPGPMDRPMALAIAEFLEKPANWSKQTSGQITTEENNFPLYAMSNPLTSTKRPDAQVRWSSVPRGRDVQALYGFHSTTPSWHFSLRPASAIEDLAEASGSLVYSGNSIRSGGQTRFVSAYIPRSPMTSIGQFQTACFTVADHQALYSVGHSFPTPYIKPESVWRWASNWTNYDHTWLINSALWDHFYFSTIAPEVNPTVQGIPTVKRPQIQVWEDFRTGKDSLLNQSFVLNPIADTRLATRLINDADGYLKSAEFLYQNGTFNINSTDERAWKAILGGNRSAPVPTTNSQGSTAGSIGGPKDSTNKALTALPRFSPLAFGANETKNFAHHTDINDKMASWKSAKALDDTQLEKLAQAIVKKIRLRWSYDRNMTKPTLKYEGTDGITKITRPFFSLAEFVNRALLPDKGGDPPDIPGNGKLGVIQAAIFHADKKLAANINGGMYQDGLDINQSKLANAEGGLGSFPAPEVANHPDGPFPVSTGAPGTLLQGDILQAIGSKISPRSDTFTIRTYGDVGGLAGGKATGRAWLEAVVQRTPEYVDNSKGKNGNAPHDPQPHRQVKEGFKEKLSPVNKYLGRRFRIVSVRWLSENEL
jgi:hypothetical protein